MPTTLLLAPPLPISRPSYGPDVEDKIEFVSSAQQPTQ